jgi:hypothetical protein
MEQISNAAESMLDALYMALDLEDAAKSGAPRRSRPLDVPYRFRVIRAAISTAHAAGVKDEWDR